MKATIWKWMICVSVVAALCGCAAVNVPPPQSASETLAYAYATVAGLRNSATQDLQAGSITVAQAQKVLTITDEARTALDLAEQAEAGAASGGVADISQELAAATALVTQVQAILPTK